MRTAWWCCGLWSAVLAGGALAADEAVPALGGVAERRAPAPLWELGLGAAVLSLPDYRGSDESRSYLLPLPYLVYRGDWLRADRDGARAMLVKTDRFKVDVSVAASVPTHSEDNAARSGMPSRAAVSRLRVGTDAATLTSTLTRSTLASSARAPSRSARSQSPR